MLAWWICYRANCATRRRRNRFGILVYFCSDAVCGRTTLGIFSWCVCRYGSGASCFVDDYLQTEGWQQASGISAIGSGQIWGVGYLKGGGEGLFARSNDFIFSVAGEEFGFIGAIILLAILIAIICCLLRTAKQVSDYKGKMICTGFAALIAAQSIINIGMVLRLLPVIGITLPFFSAGGSSVATLYLGVGLCLSVFYQSKTRNLNRGMFRK